MPSKEYRIWLAESAYIVVDFVMLRGCIVSFVVRLMCLQAGREVNVARYDTAHGAPHRDVLGKRAGLLAKTWYLEADLSQVLRQAVNDFKRHHESYIATYLQN
ncbi:MAG: DUF7718 family protein [Limisphaerales bacterium]